MKNKCIFNALQTSLSGGIGRYSYELAKSIYDKESGDIKIVIREEDREEFSFAKDNDLIIVKGINGSLKRNIYEQFVLPFKVRRIDKNAIIHYPDTMAPLLSLNKVVITVHDLAFKTLKGAFTWKTTLWKRTITPLSIMKASKVVAITNFAQDELKNHYANLIKGKVEVVYNGFNNLSEENKSGSIENENVRRVLDNDYILTVSTISPRKNIDGLIRAFNLIKDKTDCNLVIAGKNGWLYEEVYNEVEKLNLKDRVVFTGGVSDYELSALYKNCSIFTYPSFYEGFGLPPLEAMSYGKKCVVSNRTSIPEVVGDAGIYFEPDNIGDIAIKIEEGLNLNIDKNNINAVLNKFSWKKCAEDIISKVYNAI